MSGKQEKRRRKQEGVSIEARRDQQEFARVVEIRMAEERLRQTRARRTRRNIAVVCALAALSIAVPVVLASLVIWAADAWGG